MLVHIENIKCITRVSFVSFFPLCPPFYLFSSESLVLGINVQTTSKSIGKATFDITSQY